MWWECQKIRWWKDSWKYLSLNLSYSVDTLSASAGKALICEPKTFKRHFPSRQPARARGADGSGATAPLASGVASVAGSGATAPLTSGVASVVVTVVVTPDAAADVMVVVTVGIVEQKMALKKVSKKLF